MKTVFFGVGRFFENRKNIIEQYGESVEKVAYIDNNELLWSTQIDGINVMAPSDVIHVCYDGIVLMSAKTDEMKSQLLSYGISEKVIWSWYDFCVHANKAGEMQFFGDVCFKEENKKALVIGINLHYDGSTMALFHAADVLIRKKYDVVITAPGGNPKFIQEMKKRGYCIVLCPCLPYIHMKERKWIEQFDFFLINTFPMLAAVTELSKVGTVIWWIHECRDSYEWVLNDFEKYALQNEFANAYICAVCDFARKNFNTYYPERVDEILPYSISDSYDPEKYCNNRTGKVIFAVIGALCPRKAQKDFVEAIKLLNEKERTKAEFWLIGGLRDEQYTEEVRQMIQGNSDIKICGEMTREEIELAYEKIDVVVCCSQEEMLPVVVTEGLMFRKVCIMADNSGMKQYIEHKKNGFIYETGNINALSQNIEYAIDNLDNLDDLRSEARKTYETYFKMDIFEKRLEQVVENALERFGALKEKEIQ